VGGEFGVYIHIPFCVRRCDYCAFATWTDRGHLVEAYLDALIRDIERAEPPPATSVFVGGGTPTSVPAAALGRVLDAVRRVPSAEVTVECNPDDVTVDLLRTYADHGVNRVSVGVQSMDAAVLDLLGRSHVPANVESAVSAALVVGIPTFNVDLIYGAVGESVASWEQTVRSAIALDVPHVSAYGLTVEPGTPLAVSPQRHPDDDDLADKYEVADELFAAAGLLNYEVSNWARPGHECRHNRLYWSQGDYRGFGCAAHSHSAGRRWWNVRTPERYIALVARSEPTEAAGEDLDAETRRIEGLQLALRTSDGVPTDALEPDDLTGLIEPAAGERVRLTRAGRLLANEVSLRLR